MTTLQITDDLDLLLAILPLRIRSTLVELENIADLLEVVMDLATRITVLNFGQVLATGAPAEIRANPAVQEAYLGA